MARLFDDVRASMDLGAAANSGLRVRGLVATTPHTPHADAGVRSLDRPQGGGAWGDMALCTACGAMGLTGVPHAGCTSDHVVGTMPIRIQGRFVVDAS